MTVSVITEEDAMSALMMALVAGLAVGSDGTERISTETKSLAIEGYWEGVKWYIDPFEDQPITCIVKFEPGWVIIDGLRINSKWLDEGRGKCRLIQNGSLINHAIYKRETGQLVICCAIRGDRPVRFQPRFDGNLSETILYILKPAKPPKK
jgi:hypothetical protein